MILLGRDKGKLFELAMLLMAVVFAVSAQDRSMKFAQSTNGWANATGEITEDTPRRFSPSR
jgi:hypothetical protein